MPFLIKVRDVETSTDDLTLAEAERIEAYTGESWLTLNPLRSAKHCAAVMVELLVRQGVGREQAVAEVGELRLNDALEHVRHVADDLPEEFADGFPNPEGAPSTSGSSGAPSDSAGLPT